MRVPVRTTWRALTWAGSAGAAALTAHTVINGRLLRRPDANPGPVGERVSVLLPVRDEVESVEACVRALLAQTGVLDLEVIVLDDSSTDGTAAVVERLAAADPRLRPVTGAELPQGWLGKPHACDQLARLAGGSVLVFVDADVRLAPSALASTVGLLRSAGLDLVCPYPRQEAGSLAERLVQPLLQWSWLTTLPLRLAERSPRPSLSAANGQLLAVDAEAYRRAGGHAAVRDEVVEDVALLRAVKRSGGTGGVVDGSTIAVCHMYDGWTSVREGYTKSLWSAFGSPSGAAGVVAVLGLCYVVPPLAALGGSPVGLGGYAAGVGGRYVAARRTGGRALPDSLAHPLSITLFGWLTASSWRRRRNGSLRWKGRSLAAAVLLSLLAACGGGGVENSVAGAQLMTGPTTTDVSAAASPSPGRQAPGAALVLPARGATPSSSPGPLPAATVGGALVAGFPADVLPLPPGAKVTSSAVDVQVPRAPDGTVVVGVSLTGTTDLSHGKITAFYRRALAAGRFTATDDGVSGGVGSATFSRDGGNEVLVLADAEAGGTHSFSIGGTLAQ